MDSELETDSVEADDGLTPERIAQLRAALEIALEPEIALAFGAEPRTAQMRRVTGKDVFPHFRYGRTVIYHIPSVKEEIRRRVEGTGSAAILESVAHRARPRRRRAS